MLKPSFVSCLICHVIISIFLPLQGLQQIADAMEPGNTDMSKTDMITKNDGGALSRSDLSFPLRPIICYCFYLPFPDNDLFAGLVL